MTVTDPQSFLYGRLELIEDSTRQFQLHNINNFICCKVLGGGVSSDFVTGHFKWEGNEIAKDTKQAVQIAFKIFQKRLQLLPKFPFHHIGPNHYYFSNYKNRFDAKAECEHKGANLAHPNSWEENKKIRNYMKNGGDNNYYWIGGTDMNRKGCWEWSHDKSIITQH
ncbi:hypothetical protein CHUAL_000035 [Chamberlinius hualienensis]